METAQAEYKLVKKLLSATEKAAKTIRTASAIAQDSKDYELVRALLALSAKLEIEITELKKQQLEILFAN